MSYETKKRTPLCLLESCELTEEFSGLSIPSLTQNTFPLQHLYIGKLGACCLFISVQFSMPWLQ